MRIHAWAIVAGVVIAIIVIAASLPYMVGWIVSSDTAYYGVYDASPADTYAYYAMIEQARQGKWLLDNSFTFEIDRTVLVQPLWVLLGKIAAITGSSTMMVYHVVRVVAGIGLLWFIYRLTAWITRDHATRILLLIVAGCSGGFSWIMTPLLLGGSWGRDALFFLIPSDGWITESNTFLTLLHTPLFMVSQLLMMGLFVAYDRNLQDPQPRRTECMMLGMALLALLHPYDIVIVMSVMIAHAVIFGIPWRGQWKPVMLRVMRQLFLYGVAVIPVALYYLWAFYTEPSLSGWRIQNITESPPVSSYIFGFGLLWPGLILFLVHTWNHGLKQRQLGILVAWVVVVALLAYAPFDVNRRWTNGVHIPFALLSGAGYLLAVRYVRTRFHLTTELFVIPTIIGMVLLAATPIYSVLRGIEIARQQPLVFALPREVDDAAIWARQHTPQDAKFFVHPTVGVHWAAVSGRSVYIGHGHQTPMYEQKLATVIREWIDGNPDQQEFFLAAIQPDYIVVLTLETQLQPTFSYTSALWPVVYENSKIRIYQYVPGATNRSEIGMIHSAE